MYNIHEPVVYVMGFPGGSDGKDPPVMWETQI